MAIHSSLSPETRRTPVRINKEGVRAFKKVSVPSLQHPSIHPSTHRHPPLLNSSPPAGSPALSALGVIANGFAERGSGGRFPGTGRITRTACSHSFSALGSSSSRKPSVSLALTNRTLAAVLRSSKGDTTDHNAWKTVGGSSRTSSPSRSGKWLLNVLTQSFASWTFTACDSPKPLKSTHHTHCGAVSGTVNARSRVQMT
mmetsp:Transcript_38457/g.96346  ORF Transcript_38457/g.96346 Transcript_38457/m.96346 type:complete len:200 (+) Transcript_38457:182-781(+)